MINADIKEVIIPSNIFNDSFFLFALCNIFIILYKFKIFLIVIISWQPKLFKHHIYNRSNPVYKRAGSLVSTILPALFFCFSTHLNQIKNGGN